MIDWVEMPFRDLEVGEKFLLPGSRQAATGAWQKIPELVLPDWNMRANAQHLSAMVTIWVKDDMVVKKGVGSNDE